MTVETSINKKGDYEYLVHFSETDSIKLNQVGYDMLIDRYIAIATYLKELIEQ